uniref:(northern house mosquito) hypothetical protein n=1 Tax=Culex pipiens TaxID=7175 RepID=A0A8D8NYU3_CULPI
MVRMWLVAVPRWHPTRPSAHPRGHHRSLSSNASLHLCFCCFLPGVGEKGLSTHQNEGTCWKSSETGSFREIWPPNKPPIAFPPSPSNRPALRYAGRVVLVLEQAGGNRVFALFHGAQKMKIKTTTALLGLMACDD